MKNKRGRVRPDPSGVEEVGMGKQRIFKWHLEGRACGINALKKGAVQIAFVSRRPASAYTINLSPT